MTITLSEKVSLVQLNGKKRKDVVGYQYHVPRRGKPYSIYLTNGQPFETDPVKDIKKTYSGIFIKTDKAIYRLKYLDQALHERMFAFAD